MYDYLNNKKVPISPPFFAVNTFYKISLLIKRKIIITLHSNYKIINEVKINMTYALHNWDKLSITNKYRADCNCIINHYRLTTKSEFN